MSYKELLDENECWDNCLNCNAETPLSNLNIGSGLCFICDQKKQVNLDKVFDDCVKKYGWKNNGRIYSSKRINN